MKEQQNLTKFRYGPILTVHSHDLHPETNVLSPREQNSPLRQTARTPSNFSEIHQLVGSCISEEDIFVLFSHLAMNALIWFPQLFHHF